MNATHTVSNGVTASSLPQSPSVPQSEAEMLPLIKELAMRKSANGESLQLQRNGRNVLALLRNELKSRLNMDNGTRLPDDLHEMAEKAVHVFIAQLMDSFLSDGMTLTNYRRNVTYVRFDKDCNIKEDGMMNQAKATRDLRNDGERLAAYQESRRQLTRRIESMEKTPGKYDRTEIDAVKRKLKNVETVISKIVPSSKLAEQ